MTDTIIDFTLVAIGLGAFLILRAHLRRKQAEFEAKRDAREG